MLGYKLANDGHNTRFLEAFLGTGTSSKVNEAKLKASHR
jgi:hypothetical protein